LAGNWGEAAITAHALSIFALALSIFALALAVFALAVSIFSFLVAIFVAAVSMFALPVSMFALPVSMFLSVPAWPRLNSPSILVETKSGNCVETFPHITEPASPSSTAATKSVI